MNGTGNSTHIFNQTRSQILTPLPLLALITSSDNTSEYKVQVNFTESELFQYNATNDTHSTEIWTTVLETILEILSLSPLIIIMLAMGCEIHYKNILDGIKKPMELCIGAFCQFVIMPASAYCILLLNGITGLHATGVVIISCSPGGGLSNIFTYFCDGDLALSVTMTTASTLVGMGMMPFNIWLYGSQFETDDLVIPYKNLAMSIVIASTPMIIGMLIKWKFPKVASRLSKVGSYLGIFLALISLAIEVVLYPNMFTDVPFKLYFVLFSLPFIGLTMGYAFASLLKQEGPVRKAVSIECGIQNVPIALSVIVLSYTPEVQEKIILYPYIYLFGMSTGCILFCVTYNFWKKYLRKTTEEPPVDNPVKQDLLAEDIKCRHAKEVKLKPNRNPFKFKMGGMSDQKHHSSSCEVSFPIINRLAFSPDEYLL